MPYLPSKAPLLQDETVKAQSRSNLQTCFCTLWLGQAPLIATNGMCGRPAGRGHAKRRVNAKRAVGSHRAWFMSRLLLFVRFFSTQMTDWAVACTSAIPLCKRGQKQTTGSRDAHQRVHDVGQKWQKWGVNQILPVCQV